MDEFNPNNQNPNEENQNTTPHNPGDPSQNVQFNSDGTYRGGHIPSDNTSGSYRTYSSGFSGDGNGPTYSQWNSGSNAPKPPKRPRRTILRTVGGIMLAVVVVGGAFVGGMAVSGGVDFSNFNLENNAASVESGSGEQAQNSTTLQVASSNTTGSGETDDGLTSTAIYQKVTLSVVTITVNNLTEGSSASGSGVIMSKDGYVITNEHVVEDGNAFTVTLSDGKTSYQATLVGSDAQTDLAVLKVKATDLTAAEFGDSSALQVGDRCYAIGSPLGIEFENSFTGGYISAIDRDVTVNDYVMTLIQTDASINAGSSGGALINKYGQVIGITNSKLSAGSYTSSASIEGMAFAIPTSTVQEIVNELIAHGHVTGRPAIGISGYNITENMAQYYNVPEGVLVTQVDTSSDAYKQGIQANDIIIAVNGKTITCMDDINSIKGDLKAGDTLTLTVSRSGDKMKFQIKLIDQADLSGTYASNGSSSNSSENNGGNNGGYYGYFGNGGY